jgi:hypothetical protein
MNTPSFFSMMDELLRTVHQTNPEITRAELCKELKAALTKTPEDEPVVIQMGQASITIADVPGGIAISAVPVPMTTVN